MFTFTSTPFSIRLSGSDFISQWVYVAFSEAELVFFWDSDFFAYATLFLSRPPSPSLASDEPSRALPALLLSHHHNVYICGHKYKYKSLSNTSLLTLIGYRSSSSPLLWRHVSHRTAESKW